MNTKINEQYETLQKDIQVFIDEVSTALKKNSEKQTLCKGWRVMFSPLIEKSEIMFIGINPGDGQTGVIDLEHSDKEHLEYLDWDYPLAKFTKDVFKKINSTHLLEKSVKTNYFYLSTTNQPDLYVITEFLGRGENKLGERVFAKAREWTNKLIEIVQPKIIICEGKEAYSNVTELFGDRKKLEDNCGYTELSDNKLIIVGYDRTRGFNNENNKESLANLLKPLITLN